MCNDIKLGLTLKQALDLQSACMYAATIYDKEAKAYPEGDDLRAYFEKRVRESQSGANLVRDAIVNPKWEAQLAIIERNSHDDKWL